MEQNIEINDLSLLKDFLKTRVESPLLEKIVPNNTLAELGVDSLMLVELMFEFEDKTGIAFPSGAQLPNTVGELLQQLNDFRSKQTSK